MRPTLLIDRSNRARFEISGAHAVATLNGLVTNDVAALKDGQGQYAAVLTAKGKIVADVIVLMLDGRLQLHASPEAGPGLHAMLVKFINPRFASLQDISAATSEQTLTGEDSAHVLARSVGGIMDADSLTLMPPYTHAPAMIASSAVTILRLPDMGFANEPVFSVLAPSGSALAVRGALRSAGAADADAKVLDTLRVESGFPAWGVDMDETTLSQEANLDELHAISYTKGCYIGQETVARVHFRGHVNRYLRRLNFTGDVLPPRGAMLQDSEHRSVGDVRSTAVSSRCGPIGIGMVRRDADDGSTLDVHWEGGATSAVVGGQAKGAIE